jgi:hypothetical protein
MSTSLRRCAAVLVVALLSVSIAIFAVTRSSAGRSPAILRVDHAGLPSDDGLLEYMLPAAIFGAEQNSQSRPTTLLEMTGSAKVGASCFFDSSCASGHCAGVLSRRCVECKSDKHCGPTDEHGVGLSAPSEAPAAFCVKARCSKWKRGKSIPSEGYPVTVGAKANAGLWSSAEDDVVVRVPRKVQTYLPGVLMYRIHLTDQPEAKGKHSIAINRTHVRIPRLVQLRAGYVAKSLHCSIHHCSEMCMYTE